MDMLTLKLGQSSAEQKQDKLVDLLQKRSASNNLGQIETKEQNLQNIGKMKENMQKQEEQMSLIRDSVKSAGSMISEGISAAKMKEMELKEKEMERQRMANEQEVNQYIGQQKDQRKNKQQELEQVQQELTKQERQLSTLQQSLAGQELLQKDDLQKRDDAFSKEMYDKEQMLQNMMKQLNDLKNLCKDEKKKTDELEEMEDGLVDEHERMVGELERLDEELDELEDDDDDDLLMDKLMQEIGEMQNFIDQIDDEDEQTEVGIKEQNQANEKLKAEVDQLNSQMQSLESDVDIEELQKRLQQAQEEEKCHFEENLKIVNDLKQIEEQQQDQGKGNIQLERKVNQLIYQNHVERKSRNIEGILRDFEDKLREKSQVANEIKRKIDRLEDLIQNEGLMKTSGLQGLREKLLKFDEDLKKLEIEKETIRNNKKMIDEQVVGKVASDLSEGTVKKCIQDIRDLEKVLDALVQKENDILIIDRQKKVFSDIEKAMCADYFKKCKQLKEQEEKKSSQILKKIDNIFLRTKHLENEVLPHVTKIADDEDEIEILRSKKEILKEIKRSAINICEHELEQNLTPKIARVNPSINDLYELIEQYKDLSDLDVEVNGIEKETNQLEKRLNDFEQNLRQFEVELKQDFYEDTIKEINGQTLRLKTLEDQIWKLNEGIKNIEEAIQQVQSSSQINEMPEEIQQLKESLDVVKEMRNQLEKDKRELNRDGQILQGELKVVDIDKVTADDLEIFDAETLRQGDVISEQEKTVNDALNKMKMVQQNAQAVAFKRKADKRQDCKQKLKKIEDNVDELDRILSEIGNALELVEKDAEYLKESQWSPVKQRPSMHRQDSTSEDNEKIKDVAKQFKEIQKQKQLYEELQAQKDQLQKSLKQYQNKFDSLPLEQSGLSEYEDLYDSLSSDIVQRSEQAQTQAKHQLENDLKSLKEVIEQLIEKFKQKKAVLNDCKKEEGEKEKEIQKVEVQMNGLKMKIGQMERELLNQQSMNFKANEEKKKQSQDLLEDVTTLKQSIKKKQDEIESEKQKLLEITKDIQEVGDKVVTLDNLKTIYKQISQLNKLQSLKEELKQLNDDVAIKEDQVEQFIKDLLGGNLYECERKLKEAETAVDKMTKKMIETSNGMNDFEIEVKKGLQQLANDEEINREGKRLIDANNADRKILKECEDQKNMIKKVLLKIKGSLEEQNQNKGDSSLSKKLNAATIEEYIMEIETCLKKTDVHTKDISQVDIQLEKRKEEWNSLLFKSGSKDALVEDIEKSIKENIVNLQDLNQKLAEIDKLLNGFEDVSKNMMNNPDYEMQQQQIQKQLDQLNEQRQLRDQILQEKDKLEKFIKKQLDYAKKGLKTVNLNDLQQMAKQGEENTELLAQQNKTADSILKDLQRKRQKLGDGDIIDNFKERVDKLNEIDGKMKQVDKEQRDLEAIISEMNRINPGSSGDSLQQLQKSKQEIQALGQDKEKIQQKLLDLKEKLKNRDLNRDDLTSMTPLIQEIKEARKILEIKDQEINNIGQNIKYLKNKYCGIDIEKKFVQFKIDSDGVKLKLSDLLDDLEVLKELYEEFDGYTSDSQEEGFIEKLGIEIRELAQKHHMASEENEAILDQIHSAQRSIERSKNRDDLTNQEIEERAKSAAQIEEDLFILQRLVEEVDGRISKNKKTFSAMHIKDKLRRRVQEVNELNKRLDQFQNQVSEIEIDMKNEFNKLHLGKEDGMKLHSLFEELLFEVEEIQIKYDQIGQDLISIDSDITDLKESKMHQFELLKGNIKIKKKILYSLDEVKQIRQVFFTMKAKFEMNKPKKPSSYAAQKGDFVDQLLADWVNNNGCPVPIKRMGGGYYMFGTKKIYAKIINGKLVIRVGGGYMSIDEFMFYYGAQELNKMLAYQDNDLSEEIDLNKALDDNKTDVIRETSDGKGVIGIQQMKKRLSPRGASPRGPSTRGPSNRGGSPNAQSQQARASGYQNAQSPKHASPRNEGVSRTAFSKRSPSAQTSFLKQGTDKQEKNEEELKKIESLRKQRQ